MKRERDATSCFIQNPSEEEKERNIDGGDPFTLSSLLAVSENQECSIIIGKSFGLVYVRFTHTHTPHVYQTLAQSYLWRIHKRGSIFMADITRLISLEIISLFIGKVATRCPRLPEKPSLHRLFLSPPLHRSPLDLLIYIKRVRPATGRSRSPMIHGDTKLYVKPCVAWRGFHALSRPTREISLSPAPRIVIIIFDHIFARVIAYKTSDSRDPSRARETAKN